MGPMKDDDCCTVQERRCRAPGRALRRSIQLWVSCFSQGGALSHRVSQKVYTSSPHSFAKHFAFVSSSQRDAQVTRREPEKAFRHQPATQTAEVPGGRRGHQGGPKVLPLSRGHQQCVHRGADTENHGLLWIPALEGQPHQWVTLHTRSLLHCVGVWMEQKCYWKKVFKKYMWVRMCVLVIWTLPCMLVWNI